MRLDRGSVIYSYDPHYYGPNRSEHARLLLFRSLTGEPVVVSKEAGECIQVDYGKYDEKTHEKIAAAISMGKIGYAVTKEGLWFGPH